jgi:hypothetical protein
VAIAHSRAGGVMPLWKLSTVGPSACLGGATSMDVFGYHDSSSKLASRLIMRLVRLTAPGALSPESGPIVRWDAVIAVLVFRR